MCSILGVYSSKLGLDKVCELNDNMKHRGPDNSTVKKFVLKNKALYLGHNRLSIQDLCLSANQPMENAYFSIVFNGEVYNHKEIRENLKYNSFKTNSDTETILWAFTEYGINAVKEFIGMFSIALYDKLNEKLYLIRDRVGIKPLYYSFKNDEFLFSSELKGFPSYLKSEINDKSLIQFMSLGYIPNRSSYYKEINKLPAGHYLEFDGKQIFIQKYWELPKETLDVSFEEACFNVNELLQSSIKYRLLSDLEVGCFLSGGIDSSLVSAILQKESTSKVKTFSIGFESKEYDESLYAKDIASYLKTQHYEYKFKANDVLSLIENFNKYYDEPFGDASSLPMLLLAKETKKEVTVVLSGDGGDELFYGYERYSIVENYYKKFYKIPKLGRSLLSQVFKFSTFDKLEKASYPLANLSHENLYAVLNTAIKPWELENVFSKEFIFDSFGKKPSFLDLEDANTPFKTIDDYSRLDFYRYLPDDILTKVDRASMAFGLEARVPILDHRIVEYAYKLPKDIKLQNGKKSILKNILDSYIPKHLTNRPKRGFSVPLKYWFRNELKELVYAKIDSLDHRFNKKSLIKIANEHIYNNKNYEYVLWNILRIK